MVINDGFGLSRPRAAAESGEAGVGGTFSSASLSSSSVRLIKLPFKFRFRDRGIRFVCLERPSRQASASVRPPVRCDEAKEAVRPKPSVMRDAGRIEGKRGGMLGISGRPAKGGGFAEGISRNESREVCLRTDGDSGIENK